MPLDELFGTYMRLRQELADARDAPPWRRSPVDRLVREIVEVERAIAEAQPVDEQTNDLLPGI